MAKSNSVNLDNGIKKLCQTEPGRQLFEELITIGRAMMDCLQEAYAEKRDIKNAQQAEFGYRMQELVGAAKQLVPELFDEWDFKNMNSIAIQLDEFVGKRRKR